MPYKKRPPRHYKTPTFQTTLDFWQYDPDADKWNQRGQIIGQLYTPSRTMDDPVGGQLFFEYSREHDLLRDSFFYEANGKADVLIVPFPTGNPRVHGYRVRDISPRFYRFVNEHLHASLMRLTPSELSEVMGNNMPAPPWVDYHCTVEFFSDTGVIQLQVAGPLWQTEAAFAESHGGTLRKTISFWAERPDKFPVAPAPELFDPVAPVLKTKIKRKKKRPGCYRLEGVYEYGARKIRDGEPFTGFEPKYGNFDGSLLRLPL